MKTGSYQREEEEEKKNKNNYMYILNLLLTIFKDLFY